MQRLTPSQIEGVLVGYRAGVQINDLATEFGVHRGTILALLHRQKEPKRSEATLWDQAMLRQAIAQYESGALFREIGVELGVDQTTVAKRLRQAGVTMRVRAPRPSSGGTHSPRASEYRSTIRT